MKNSKSHVIFLELVNEYYPKAGDGDGFVLKLSAAGFHGYRSILVSDLQKFHSNTLCCVNKPSKSQA